MAEKKRSTARELARQMKEISFSEFIATNPHLVGFESSVKMIPMSIHEILTNSLDACESAGILPEVWIDLKSLDDRGRLKRFRLTVRDNGPGIVPRNVPLVFGKLLYGSKFGVRKQSRGQQGIGVSAVVLISQIKTGEHAVVRTSTDGRTAHLFELSVDIDRNTAKVHRTDKERADGWRGVEIAVVLEAQYSSRIMEYLELTAAINPHLSLHYDGLGEKDRLEVPRRTDAMPAQPVETKPHPSGVDYELLKRIASRTKYERIADFLRGEFDRVRMDIVKEIWGIIKDRVDPKKRPSELSRDELSALAEAMCAAKTPPPSPECLSPVGEETLIQGAVSRLEPAFIEAVTRSPRAMRGQPFLVEVIIAYNCKADLAGVGEAAIDPVTGVYVHRFVNRVPLLFSEASDVTLKAARDAGLSRYEIAPETRSHLFVHVAGVNIPYTSESKEAIKFVDEYYEEIRLAIQECGRKISKHIRSIKRSEEKAVMGKRKAIIHSLLLRELNRYAGRKVAGPQYAEAFGFDHILAEVTGEYGLDVFATEPVRKEKEIKVKAVAPVQVQAQPQAREQERARRPEKPETVGPARAPAPAAAATAAVKEPYQAIAARKGESRAENRAVGGENVKVEARAPGSGKARAEAGRPRSARAIHKVTAGAEGEDGKAAREDKGKVVVRKDEGKAICKEGSKAARKDEGNVARKAAAREKAGVETERPRSAKAVHKAEGEDDSKVVHKDGKAVRKDEGKIVHKAERKGPARAEGKAPVRAEARMPAPVRTASRTESAASGKPKSAAPGPTKNAAVNRMEGAAASRPARAPESKSVKEKKGQPAPAREIARKPALAIAR